MTVAQENSSKHPISKGTAIVSAFPRQLCIPVSQLNMCKMQSSCQWINQI